MLAKQLVTKIRQDSRNIKSFDVFCNLKFCSRFVKKIAMHLAQNP